MESSPAIDRAPLAEASRMLHACCGSTAWVDRMLARRPFGSRETLLAAAREVWTGLSADDWREAFAHHPRIGDRESLAKRFPATHHLSSREQSAVADAGHDVLDSLAAENERYLRRFGYIFIVCATGRTAHEMLTMLRARLGNPPEIEIQIAAEEQMKITELRLASTASG
jgi:2-oxo-4-hydroxy-4-carboxy-5-ureidoimidazoline decarboxylase